MGQPGFLGKEVWTDPNDPTKVYLAIHLESRELLNAIPAVVLRGDGCRHGGPV